MQVDETQLALDPSVFSDPHLESAAKTFQVGLVTQLILT